LLDGDARLVDIGAHRLKDLTEPQRLWQLGDAEFPPLKTLYQSNLPIQPTALVGRESELAEVLDLLGESRLVTLTGAGGSGKTRLALQAAAELTDEFKDGVWWVPLAALRDPSLVEPTIAQAIGAKEGLVEHLRSKRTLLLLDNFEQLLDAAHQIGALLAEAPDLRVLATSRERLGLAAEQEYAVPTMVPMEAVELFTARARQLKPGFQPDEATNEICLRLDGLPLAVELAAARIKVLRPAQILERLTHSLDLLTTGARDAPQRHRTLRATIEWSHDLLDDAERQLFARLAVFAGSFSLEAAEAVCDAELDVLAGLVDKSLLRQTDGGRFFLLETIGEYAAEQLDREGLTSSLRDRHGSYFRELAKAQGSSLGYVSAVEAVKILHLDQLNLRRALSWAEERGDAEFVTDALAALWAFWLATPYAPEAIRWGHFALERRDELSPEALAQLLVALGELERFAGEIETAERLKRDLVDLGTRIGGDPRWVVSTLADLADIAVERGDLPLARAYAERSRAEGGADRASLALGQLELAEGRLDSATHHLTEAAEASGLHDFNRAAALETLAEVKRRQGLPAEARMLFRRVAVQRHELGDYVGLADCLDGLAQTLVDADDLERAAVLVGAAESLRERWARPVWWRSPELDRLNDDAVRRGRGLDPDAALEYALSLD
nr:NB-ARC domain-containing protein [Actinomycetota bacterium]